MYGGWTGFENHMNYLDTGKSFIISSPAGSGKTEKLARRYVSLLASGSDVERIVAITFTEKASSEMKQRILRILAAEFPEIYARIRPKVPVMRISTIHSFCLGLLKRFSMELGVDPDVSVTDEAGASALWREAVSEALRQEARDETCGPSSLSTLMRKRGIRGWDGFLGHLEEVYKLRPLSEMALSENPDFRTSGENDDYELAAAFSRCLDIYKAKKKAARVIDFSDIEILAWQAIAKSPHWLNILYCFDEHTDHILVDEFQDTSTLQWRIIDKLTEEWRSGQGPKREAGKVPTIFLVGDDKQSIYLFRGADVSVMKKARQRLSGFLGQEYEFHAVKDNYRSLPCIVDFTNALFEKLMPPSLFTGQADDTVITQEYENGLVDYCPFEARREGGGKIELLLMPEPENIENNGHGQDETPASKNQARWKTKDRRAEEARMLAARINALNNRYQVHEPGGTKRPCRFSDMAILLKQRTHLASFEEALRNASVPFLVMKGMGFYEEPEIALLREFVCFLADPQDDYGLFCLLRSPLFGFSYRQIAGLFGKDKPLLEALKENGGKRKKDAEAHALLAGCLELKPAIPVARIIERLLVQSEGWRHLWEPQRRANVRKFISIVEGLEAEGMGPVAIRDKLIGERFKNEVAKANVNAEAMNAVKLMTVHAAKGLQFPMVFLPCLEEDHSAKTRAVVIEERAGKFSFRYEPSSTDRKEVPEFQRTRQKELEEEKRLFYVAITRAMDYLYMSGFDGGKPKGRLAYLYKAFGDGTGPDGLGGRRCGANGEELFEVLDPADGALFETGAIPGAAHGKMPDYRFMNEFTYTGPLEYAPALSESDVTEDILVKTRHGKDWVQIGRLMHQVLEDISRGVLIQNGVAGLEKRLDTLLPLFAPEPERAARFRAVVLEDIQKLREAGFMESVILPRQGSFAELPFMHERGKTLYKGRIDRLIISGAEALIYDYKSFPARPQEIPELVEKYRFQMELYKKAAADIFAMPARSFLLFTHLPQCLEL